MKSLVEHLAPLVQDFSPENVKRLVKVPKTYQNISSISAGRSMSGRRVCQEEKAIGTTARRYVRVSASQTSQRKGPMMARYLQKQGGW